MLRTLLSLPLRAAATLVPAGPCGRVVALLAGALLASAAGAQGAAPGSLKRGIERIVGRPAFEPAFWGIEVRSLRSGKRLYSYNAQKNFTPASTLKLVTAAAALDALGPETRVTTSVETNGSLDASGRILGDVYLVGRGDPDLSARPSGGRATGSLEGLVQALHAAGVRRIEGRLVGHEGAFSGERRGADWSWEDLFWSYGAEISSLSIMENVAELTVGPGERVGDPLVVGRYPASSYYTVASTATTSASGAESDLALFRAPGSRVIRLSGTHPAGSAPELLAVALEDPARYAATVLAEMLEARGVLVTGPVETSSEPLPPAARVLASHDSEPLSEILKSVNKSSRNLHAELLLRLLALRVKGGGSVEAGREALRDFLVRAGVPSDTWAVQDGSGLSRSDLLSPAGLVELLVFMDRHRHGRVFRESLAIAGVDGTLEKRMRGSPAAGRIRAKTGTLRQVNALAGYAEAGGGERLAFAIVVNHYAGPGREATAAIDAICELLVD